LENIAKMHDGLYGNWKEFLEVIVENSDLLERKGTLKSIRDEDD